MNILVFNCGSSSLNYKVYSPQNQSDLRVIARGKAHRVGVRGSEPAFFEHHLEGADPVRQVIAIPDHRIAARFVIDQLQRAGVQIDLIGHRFVHGGRDFHRSTPLTPGTWLALQKTLPLAPIHNPNSLSVIEVCQELLPGVGQYLTFDTAFHSSLPPEAFTYALPEDIRQELGVRKYGFHGLSYQYVSTQAANFLQKSLPQLRMIACHLGTGGSSAVAIKNGRSIDTSMGYSPLAGLIMSTRTGDMDVLLPVTLLDRYGYSAEELTTLFNKKSGLLGVSGFSSDIRDLIATMDSQLDRSGQLARLAFELYVHRLKKTIGAFSALLGGVDALVFTDDIGVQNPRVRAGACQGLSWCGIELDSAANEAAPFDQITQVSPPSAQVAVLVVPTDEELVIGQEGWRLVQEAHHAAL